jgi:hypothetical protein
MKLNKYKVWDTQEKCWVPERVMITSDGVLHIEVADREWTVPGDPERFVVCWFTGLHDKNGKEIFEGDILGLNGINTSVVFHEASFCMDSQSENRMPSPLHGDRTRMYTVVGNIYENPQLLEGG